MQVTNLIPKKSEKITSPEEAAKLVELVEKPAAMPQPVVHAEKPQNKGAKVTTDKKDELFELLKREKGISIDNASKELSIAKDYVLGIVDGNKDYILNDNYITLKGLGNDLCIVCGGKIDTSDKYHAWGCVNINSNLPDCGRVNTGDYRGIWGHKKCYNQIGLFFKLDNTELYCGCCHSQWGQMTEDENYAWCTKFGEEHMTLNPDASDKVCNFLSLRSDLSSDKYQKIWDKLKPEADKKTKAGYQKLTDILRKARLL